MKLGVIGTGNIGGTLARKLNAAGHDVLVANSRGREGVRAFANEIGATAVDTHGAAEGVDVVVLSIPFAAVAELPKDLFDTVPQDVPVIDTGNYYPGLRDRQTPEVDAGMPHSVWVSKQLGRPISKAFKTSWPTRSRNSGIRKARPAALRLLLRGMMSDPSKSLWTL
jgi:predicted dinucleotide-binding enzyme